MKCITAFFLKWVLTQEEALFFSTYLASPPFIIHQVKIKITNINWTPIAQLLAVFYLFPIITGTSNRHVIGLNLKRWTVKLRKVNY